MVFYPPSTELKNTPWKLFSRLTGFFCKDVAYIKRVIGLPGETIQILQDGTILIDDEPLTESYGREVIASNRIGNAANPISLGDGEYFENDGINVIDIKSLPIPAGSTP